MAAQMQGGRRQPGGSWWPALYLYKVAAQPMEERTHHKSDRRLHEEFKRRIKTQTVLPSTETAAMLFWALLTAGQITVLKVDGWRTLSPKLTDTPIDLAA
jgi:hypothetical protein